MLFWVLGDNRQNYSGTKTQKIKDCPYLNFYKVWVPQGHEFGIVVEFFSVPGLDQRQSVDSSLPLISQGGQAIDEPLPEVLKQRPERQCHNKGEGHITQQTQLFGFCTKGKFSCRWISLLTLKALSFFFFVHVVSRNVNLNLKKIKKLHMHHLFPIVSSALLTACAPPIAHYEQCTMDSICTTYCPFEQCSTDRMCTT